MSTRFVVINYHIFKNAGTTIDWILKKNFQDKSVRFNDQENQSRVLSPKLILDFLESHPDVKAISSEQLHEIVPNYSNLKLIPFIFIRHPLQRIHSIYTYNRYVLDGTEPFTPSAYAKLHSFSEFIQWRFQTDPNFFVNYQVRYILDLISAYKSNNIEKYFQNALEFLESSPIVGIVDRLDESLVLAEHFLKNYFPSIDLSYVIQNISKSKESGHSNISPDPIEEENELVLEKLRQKNELDLKFYQLTNKELDYRIEKIESFQNLLHDFKSRCKKISEKESEHVTKSIKKAEDEIVKQYFEKLKVDVMGEPQTLVDEGKHSEALIVLKENLVERPKWGEGHYLTAFCYQKLGKDWNAAIEHYNLALEYEFEPFWVFYRRGFLYSLMDKKEEAKKDLRKAAELKPDNEHVQHLLQKLDSNLISNI